MAAKRGPRWLAVLHGNGKKNGTGSRRSAAIGQRMKSRFCDALYAASDQ